MTLAELQDRMTAAEFEVWKAEESLRAHVCPNCGLEPRDMADGWGVAKMKCPFCKTEYHRVTSAGDDGKIHDAHTHKIKEN